MRSPARLTTGMVLVLLATLVVSGCGLVDRTGIGAQSASPAQARQVAWTVPAPTRVGDENDTFGGFAAGAETFVVFTESRYLAYRLDDGEPRWSYRAPGPVCGSTRSAPDGVVALLYAQRQSGACTVMVALDVRTGKRLWTAKLDIDRGLAFDSGAPVVAADGRIYVGTLDRVMAYDAKRGPRATGAAAPVTVQERCGNDASDEYAEVDDLRADADTVVAVVDCSNEDHLVGFDPSDLARRFTTSLGSDLDDTEYEIAAVAPVVVFSESSNESDRDVTVQVFDDDGESTTEIDSRRGDGVLDLDRGSYAIAAGTLVASVTPADLSEDPKVVGIDLVDGSTTWTRRFDGMSTTPAMATDTVGKVCLADRVGPTSADDPTTVHLLTSDPARDGKVTGRDALRLAKSFGGAFDMVVTPSRTIIVSPAADEGMDGVAAFAG